jgi:hypothetical protein
MILPVSYNIQFVGFVVVFVCLLQSVASLDDSSSRHVQSAGDEHAN